VSARGLTVFLGVLAVIALLGFGLVNEGEADLAVGEPVPDSPLPRLGESGEGRVADHRGDWVLVNFWASWCLPCRDESPALEAYWRRHRGDGLTMLGINTQDLSDDARAFVREFELTYPMLRDADGERSEEYGLVGLPETFLLDPEGKVSLIRRGPVDRDYLDEHVTPLLTRPDGGKDGTS
jgi:cytochrome c biogenesis protein CcmG/thiol:disulfide interchange protein DsbE